MTNNQNDLFTLFNLVDEHEESKKAEETKKIELEKEKREAEVQKKDVASEKQTKKDAKKATPVVDFKPNEDTIIRYYGESFSINKYFSPEELAEGILVKKKDEDPVRKPLEAEMLRKRMEKEFPELVKSHTEIVFLKDKNIIIPMMKAKKKGMMEEKVLSEDNAFPFPNLIPYELLQDFIAVAKKFGEENLEIHADIYYRMETGDYFMDIPDQTVHRYWTEVTEDSYSIIERVQDAIKVLEIHSHHSMAPIPSAQDNESERVPGMYYAIVGNIENFIPSLFVRQFISDSEGHITKSPESIFTSPFTKLPKSFSTNGIEVISNEY